MDETLEGFEVVSVSKQLVNGMLYIIIYRNEEGAEIRYTVLVSPNG